MPPRKWATVTAPRGGPHPSSGRPQALIIRHCTLCGDVQAEPLTWYVLSWNTVDGARTALKHKLCVECVATILAPLHTACLRPEMSCPHCGINTEDNYDAVYGSFIPRGVGTFSFEAPFCPPCALAFRNRMSEGGERLVDRPLGERAQREPARFTSAETWASLGIVPRER